MLNWYDFQAILKVQENLQNELEREPTDVEVAEAMNLPVQRLRRLREVGRAARNKLIKVTIVASIILCGCTDGLNFRL